jgi:hypothetical protein
VSVCALAASESCTSVSVPLVPSRVIERSYVSAETVSYELARHIFGDRYGKQDYPSAASPHTPDLIRFLDRDAIEILRYTAEDYALAGKPPVGPR